MPPELGSGAAESSLLPTGSQMVSSAFGHRQARAEVTLEAAAAGQSAAGALLQDSRRTRASRFGIRRWVRTCRLGRGKAPIYGCRDDAQP